MTVQELIDELQKVEDKNLKVHFYNDITDTEIGTVEEGFGVMAKHYGIHLSEPPLY